MINLFNIHYLSKNIMEKFLKIFSLYYRDPEDDYIANIDITQNNSKEDLVPYRNNGILLPSYDDNGKQILSRSLFSLKTINMTSAPLLLRRTFTKHAIGIYRHAYPRTISQNYGYLKETRIITRCMLYNDRICLYLNPIVYIENDTAYYIKDNGVILIYVDPYWVIQKKHQYICGVSFALTSFPEGRTSVEDGQFTEYDGHITCRSARGIIPNDFITLFDEAYKKKEIIW